MRPDLAKVTTESPRTGRASAIAKKYGGKVRIVHDPDHLYENEVGGFHSSARRRHDNYKHFSDFLSPLYGAIRTNVGRPWDDVYSEFCQFLDRRGVSGYHIFTHLCGSFGEVKTTGLYEGADGVVYEYRAGGYRDSGQRYNPKTNKFEQVRPPTYYLAQDTPYEGYFVHPRTGILSFKASRGGRGRTYHSPFEYTRKREPKVVDTITLSDGSHYKLEEVGRSSRNRVKIWFHYRIERKVVDVRRPIRDLDVEHYRMAGKVVHSYRKAKELNYAFEGVEVVPVHYYIVEQVKKERTHKRSANRQDLIKIRAYLQKSVDEDR
jgi:hypothetical protein